MNNILHLTCKCVFISLMLSPLQMEEKLLEENGQMLLIPKKEEDEEEMEVTVSTQSESSSLAFDDTETPAKVELKTEPQAEILSTHTDSTLVMLYVDSIWKEHIVSKKEDSEDDTSNRYVHTNNFLDLVTNVFRWMDLYQNGKLKCRWMYSIYLF